jgi:CRP-like cAMP-binding protein
MQGMGSVHRFWDLLTSDEQSALQAVGRHKKYRPGAILCVEGDPSTHVFVLLGGWVKILSVTDEGHENVLALRGDGDIVGETAGQTTGYRNFTVQAIDSVHALIVGYGRFNAFLNSHPGASRAYWRMMTQRLSDADTMLRRRVITSGAQRLAGLLLDLAGQRRNGADGAIEVALPLSQEELASLAGASRATATRALSNWRKRGLIRTGQRRITIIDLQGLRQVAGPPSTGQQAIQTRQDRGPSLPESSPGAFAQIPLPPYQGLRDDDSDETAEVVREALVRAWGQLRGRLDAEGPFSSWHQFLRDAMTQWTETGDSEALLTGVLLTMSERWLKERGADLNPEEHRFIKLSLTRREEEHRRSVARKLSCDAESAEDPVLALLLAIEVVKRSPDAQADRLVRTCLSRLGATEIDLIRRETVPVDLDRFRQRLTLLEWSHGPGPSRRWRLGYSAAGLIVSEYGRVLYGPGSIIPMADPVVVAACSVAGVACLGTEDGKLALWQLADRANKVSDRHLGVPTTCIAISDTAHTLVAACDDGVIRVLRGDDLSDIGRLPEPGLIWDIDVTTDRLVAALKHDGRIRVWDLESLAPVCESVTGIGAERLAIDPGGDYVIVDDAVTGSIGRFPLSIPALTAWACQAAGRELTSAERHRYIDDPSV